jgi:deoxyribodipyrimidine photo-lyase
MQTRGKHYVARAENIARFTGGRFDPRGQLDEDPAPLDDGPAPPAAPVPPADAPPGGPMLLLLHEDDLHPESLDLGGAQVVAVAGCIAPAARSPLGCAPLPRTFTDAALDDALARAAARFGVPVRRVAPDGVAALAQEVGVRQVVMPWAPVGWAADALAGVPALRVRRRWDSLCWPRATKGFFAFREHIPALCEDLLRSPAVP